MPRAVDRFNIEPTGDPNRSGTEFHFANMQKALQELLAEIIPQALENMKQAVVDFILDVTGIDLSTPESFVVSVIQFLSDPEKATEIIQTLLGLLSTNIGIGDLGDVLPKLLNAFQGIDLDAGPGAVLDAIADALSGVPVIGDIVQALTGIVGGDYTDLSDWADRIPLLGVLSGLLSGSVIPGLDASKITSGLFSQSMISGLATTLAAFPLTADLIQALTGVTGGSLSTIAPTNALAGFNPNFATDISEWDAFSGTWAWDGTEGHTSPGSLKGTASGVDSFRASEAIACTPGTVVPMSIWYKTDSLAGSGATVSIAAITLDAGHNVTTYNLSLAPASVTGTNGWTKLSGSYTQPAGGVYVGLWPYITSNATSGTVYFDDAVMNIGASGSLLSGLIPGLDVSKIISGIFAAGFIPGLDASKITSGTFSQAMITDLAADLSDLASDILDKLSSGDFDDLLDVLGGPDLTDISDRLDEFLTSASSLDAGKLIGLVASMIPALDASKITSGTLLGTLIPSLDASKIGSGTFSTSLIPTLAASIIGSGIFNASQIPGLDASKITTGLFSQSQISGLTSALATFLTSSSSLDATKLTGLVASLIPNLDASKITSGAFSQSMVTGLATTLATFLTSSSSLDATKLTGLVASLIPNLDASKITSGAFSQSMVANLATDLGGKAAASTVTTIAQNIYNSWFGGSTATGTPTEVATAIGAIKTALSAGSTVAIFSTSNSSWAIPAGVTEIIGCVINGGNKGNNGTGGQSTQAGGTGGLGGGYLSAVLDLTGLTPGSSTLNITVGAAASTAGGTGGVSSIVASTGTLLAGSAGASGISSTQGLIGTTSTPGNGGAGGQALASGTTQPGIAGGNSGIAAGGAGGLAKTSGGGTGNAGGNGGAGNAASVPICGGGGGGGGGGNYVSTGTSLSGGKGGDGGFPGGGSGGGGGAHGDQALGTKTGGSSGTPGNGLVVLIYK